MHTLPSTNASRRDLARVAMVAAISTLAPADARADSSFDVVAALAHHPIIGRWLGVTALGPADMQFDTGGGVFVTWPHSGDDEVSGNYYEYSSVAAGAWRPTSATEFEIAVVLGNTDDLGMVIGATVLESHGVVEDASFRATDGNNRIMRASFAANPALDLITSLAPLSGIRMWPEQ